MKKLKCRDPAVELSRPRRQAERQHHLPNRRDAANTFSSPGYISICQIEEGKPVNSKPHFPQENEENIDILESVQVQKELALAKFSTFNLWLPLELEPQLQALVGKKIGVLRLGGFWLCCIDAPDEGASDDLRCREGDKDG